MNNTAKQQPVTYQPGQSIKDVAAEHSLPFVIKLASNENPYQLSKKAADAIRAEAPDLRRYPDDHSSEMRERLAEINGVNADQIVLGNGSSEILEMIARRYLKPGDEIITSEYAFILYAILANRLGAVRKTVSEQEMVTNLPSICDDITDKTKIIFIANPNNPTGLWIPFDQIRDFMQQVPQHVMVVMDEAYFEYMNDHAEYETALSLMDQHQNLIVTRTFSKIYGLAGLRLGYGMAQPQVIQDICSVRNPFNVNSVALAAGQAVLDDENYIARCLMLNAKSRKFLYRSFVDMGYTPMANTANFLTIDFGEDVKRVHEQLLREGIIIRPLGPYGMNTHLRITVGTEFENSRLLSAFRKVMLLQGEAPNDGYL